MTPPDMEAYEYFKGIAGELIQYLFATVPPVNFATTPPDYGDRVQSLSSIDNNINNVVMEKQSGAPPWNQIRYFVITPDQKTDDAVRTSLRNLGVDKDDVFTEGIPPTFQGDVFDSDVEQNRDVGPLGLGKGAVDFWTALRYAMPDDEQAANAWRKSLPLTVLRVRRVSGDFKPFDKLVADVRNGQNESNLGDDLTALVDAVIQRANSQGLEQATDPEPMIDLLNGLKQFGPACRKIGMNCLGETQDASYFLFKPRPLDTGRIYAVVSTLATEMGNGTYVGLSVNDASLLKGVLNIPDTKLKGSASSYYSDVLKSVTLEKFFVHFFTRDCDAIAHLTDGACTTITAKMVPLAGDDKAPGDANLHGKFSAAVRAYVAVGSERGPDPPLQLPPVLITFQPKLAVAAGPASLNRVVPLGHPSVERESRSRPPLLQPGWPGSGLPIEGRGGIGMADQARGDRTPDGRKARMFRLVNELLREALAIWVKRRPNSDIALKPDGPEDSIHQLSP